MTQMTLEKALELNGMSQEEGSTMTPPQKKFLIKSTTSLISKHNEAWVKENRGRLKAELELVFKEI